METLEHPDVQIQDVMSVTPIIIRKNETVRKAAKLMKDADVGSLIVLNKKEEIEGIVTENDIVFDTVAEGLNPSEVTVQGIMSTPVHTIEGDKTILDCAKIMAEEGIRRLPVTRDGEMIGMITENDIIELSPALMDITREYDRIYHPDDLERYIEPNQREISGYCESCGVYSDKLVSQNSALLCPECR
ncbi:MAG: cyclic nucleotide-binding/CBS domain-containing protein [Candidatus Saliniplasma sp.]